MEKAYFSSKRHIKSLRNVPKKKAPIFFIQSITLGNMIAKMTSTTSISKKSSLVHKRRRTNPSSNGKAVLQVRFSTECFTTAQCVKTLENERKAMLYKQADHRVLCFDHNNNNNSEHGHTTDESRQSSNHCSESDHHNNDGESLHPVVRTMINALKRRKRIQRFVDMVLEEQLDQWDTSSVDPERLAQVSIEGSKQCRLEAIARGNSDASTILWNLRFIMTQIKRLPTNVSTSNYN